MSTRQPPFLNRELSWLEFNRRVLEEAEDPKNPILERLRFFCIFHSNLDEFFMVRVASLLRRIHEGDGTPDPAGLTPYQQMGLILGRVKELEQSSYELYISGGRISMQLRKNTWTIISPTKSIRF